MKNAVIGVRVHSGWGAVVAVSGSDGKPEIVERKRVIVIDPKAAGTKPPFHFAETMSLENAERHLASCEAASQRLALAAIGEILDALRAKDYRVIGSVILLASGRTLPALPEILKSHALIHTAEGEFFRKIFRDTFERLQTRVTGFHERELVEFGNAVPGIVQGISDLRKLVGSPWTMDEKTAALAAWMLLNGESV